LSFAFSFIFVVAGFMTGTMIAQSLVGRYGLDGTIRLGVTCLALGGLTMPQSMASALMPFPDRAGAGAARLGSCQMTIAAIVGILLGRNLDASAIPLPATIATTGVLALALFLATGRARAHQPKG
jgi:DHA1 family bicyclomycin/chloramphenicol resistance-like MFS transporter